MYLTRTIIAIAALAALAASVPAHAAPEILRYKVRHSKYGSIGTYSNTIERIGDVTEVTTDVQFAVSFLGFVLYREESRRTEHWLGDRLTHFYGTTTINGTSQILDGEAEGESFVIKYAGRTVTVPGDVHPANPWSANFTRASNLMQVDTGTVEQVTVSDGRAVSAKVGGEDIAAHLFEIQGASRYHVWLSDSGLIPVMFRVHLDDEDVTFVLVH